MFAEITTKRHSFPRIKRHGMGGIVIQFADRVDEAANKLAIQTWQNIQSLEIVGVLEVAPTLCSVYIAFDWHIVQFEVLKQKLESCFKDQLSVDDESAPKPKRWRIPCCFDEVHAPDLTMVSTILGRSQKDLINDLTSNWIRVMAIGFQAGQPYLGTLPENWEISRREILNPKIPEGAIATAVRQIVLFGKASPTGWHHIGQTKFKCFDLDREDCFALSASDEIRFEAISKLEFDALPSSSFGGAIEDATS